MASWGIGGNDRAWAYPFGERPWSEILALLGGMAANYPEFRYMVDVIDSGADHLLAGNTSMHDLMVVPHPVRAQVRDMIVVRGPGSLRPAAAGQARIEHLSSTGHNDSIERPSSEAVALFWRFVIEKYGIRAPDRST
jgi:hypothetical protein